MLWPLPNPPPRLEGQRSRPEDAVPLLSSVSDYQHFCPNLK